MSISTLPATAPTNPFPPVRLLTAEEFANLYDGQNVELINGIVEELPMPKSNFHGKACARMTTSLTNYSDQHDCGHVISNDTWIRTTRAPDSVRGPDIFYISYGRLPKDALTHDLIQQTPELVVEVKSPTDSWPKMLMKAKEYLAAGVVVVVLVNPETRTASVCRSDIPNLALTADDSLILPDVLPSFSLKVGSLFA